MTDEKTETSETSAERAAVAELVDAGLLDGLMARVAGEVQLTGEGGFFA